MHVIGVAVASLLFPSWCVICPSGVFEAKRNSVISTFSLMGAAFCKHKSC